MRWVQRTFPNQCSFCWADDTNTGATDINDLSDAKTDASNVFLGIVITAIIYSPFLLLQIQL